MDADTLAVRAVRAASAAARHRVALAHTTALRTCERCPVRAECVDTWADHVAASPKGGSYTADVVVGGIVWVNGHGRASIADLTPPPERKPAPRAVEPCGTRAAYRRHIRRREPACDPCCAAEREFQAQRRAARKAAA